MSLTWYPPGQSVRFEDLSLAGGMFYSCPQAMEWPGEPSAIITSASVAPQADLPSKDLAYCPSYADLSSAQRRTYLEWLAAGRRDRNPDQRALGYLFLFFYGLERRILFEGDRNPALVEELIELLRHYAPHHKSRSLQGYFLNLAHYAAYLMGPQDYRHYWARFLRLDGGKTGEEAMRLILANLHQLGEPLHWSIAYRLALADQSCRKSVVVTRAKQEFWSLFGNRYENLFPHGGLVLGAARHPAVFEYRPASSGLIRRNGFERTGPCYTHIANVAGLHSQFRRLSEIWNSCVDDLSGYSRAIASNKPTDAAGLKTWLALPEELRLSRPSPMQPFWNGMMRHGPQEGEFYFVRVGAIADWFGISRRPKLTRTQATEIAYGTAAMGWIVAPHPDHVDQTFSWDQEIVIYKRQSSKPPEPQIPGLVRLLYLVMPVAVADGTVEQSEIDAFCRMVDHEVTTEEDWRYLEAVVAALMRDTNVALQAIPAMTRHFTAKNRDAVFHLLVHIAAADGEVALEELKVLRKIARGLDLDPDAAERILREDIAFREVTVAEARPASKGGEPIPQKPSGAPASFQLDMDRVATLTQETHEVVAMLAAVMVEDEQPAPPARESKQTHAESAVIPDWASGIEARYQRVLVHLVGRDAIQKDDFDALAAEHHLMPDDLLNSINAWADETLGDFLLDREDPIRIYRELLSSKLSN